MKLLKAALAGLAGLCLLAGSPAWAVDNLSVKDSTGATKTTCAIDISGILNPCHIIKGWDGTTYRNLKVDVNGELQVDVLTIPSITGTVTANVGTTNGLALNTSVDGLEGATGTTADAACADDGTTACTIVQMLKRIAGRLTVLDGRVDGLEGAIGTAADSAWSGSGAGSLVATGKATAAAALDTTTPVPVNNAQVGGVAASTNIGPANSGSSRVAVAFPGATNYTVNISTATTTEIIPASGSLTTYVLFDTIKAYGTGSFTWVYGTGTNCGTGTTAFGGVNNMVANYGWVEGNGQAPIMTVPSGKALCALTSAAVQISGRVLALQQ